MSDTGQNNRPPREARPDMRSRINAALESAGRWLSRLIGRRNRKGAPRLTGVPDVPARKTRGSRRGGREQP